MIGQTNRQTEITTLYIYLYIYRDNDNTEENCLGYAGWKERDGWALCD